MRIPIPADKAKELEVCAAKIAELLQAAKTLDEAAIPDSAKNLPVWELEETPERVKNMLSNMGVCTLWELVHFDMAKCRHYRGGFNASRYRMMELGHAIKEAIDMLLSAQDGSKQKLATMSGEETTSDEEQVLEKMEKDKRKSYFILYSAVETSKS